MRSQPVEQRAIWLPEAKARRSELSEYSAAVAASKTSFEKLPLPEKKSAGETIMRQLMNGSANLPKHSSEALLESHAAVVRNSLVDLEGMYNNQGNRVETEIEETEETVNGNRRQLLYNSKNTRKTNDVGSGR